MQKRVYELTVLVPDGTDEKKLSKIITDLLAKSGGKVLKTDFWGKKQLVYPVKKQNRAIYGHFLLEMVAFEAIDLQKRLKLENEVVRYLLVVTNQKIKEEKKAKSKAKK